MKRIIYLILSSAFIQLSCNAQNPKPKQYQCLHISNEDLVLDGIIDEEAWGNTRWTENFLDIQGPDFPKPYLQTKAKMLWDDSTLYIAIYIYGRARYLGLY